jgi:copper homeostasis protein
MGSHARTGRISLEICVESAAGAQAAIAGGADRLELCAALALGGLTPSQGLVAAVLAIAGPAGVPVRAMVRPRAGDFAYDADMLDLAKAEAAALLAQGVDGLVFGAARGGVLDVAMLADWVSSLSRAFAPPGLTLHRAVDLLDDPVSAVESAVALGFDHILTSGGAPIASDGKRAIAAMVVRAQGRCTIMAGAGVTPDTVAALVRDTGVRAVHASASTLGHDGDPAAARLSFGVPPRMTDAGIVARLRHAIDDISNLGQM